MGPRHLWREGSQKTCSTEEFFLSSVFASFDEIACASKRRKEAVNSRKHQKS